MQRILLTFLLAYSAIATAAEIVRCGKDDFSNIVCLDKEGVITAPPKGTGVAASGVPAAGSEADAMDWLRCGTDPFGNKVCRP